MKYSGRFSALVGVVLVGNVAAALAQPSVPRSERTYRNPIIDRLGPADPAVVWHDGKYSGNPIAQRGHGVFGPGHHCVVTAPDGKLWMVYHQQSSEKIGWDRFLAIDPLWFDEQGVIHVKTTRGTDEPAP